MLFSVSATLKVCNYIIAHKKIKSSIPFCHTKTHDNKAPQSLCTLVFAEFTKLNKCYWHKFALNTKYVLFIQINVLFTIIKSFI